MRKALMFLGIMSLMTIVSCKKKEDMTVPPPPPPTIINEINAPADTIIVKEEQTEGTSIKVGSEGLDISTKEGQKKTNVNVNGGEATIEIKR